MDLINQHIEREMDGLILEILDLRLQLKGLELEDSQSIERYFNLLEDYHRKRRLLLRALRAIR